jgi:hypothetical protein
MAAGQQGQLNKAFVSAINFLDQRDINPNLLDVARDAAFTDIMKLVGRYKEAKVPIYNYFVNNNVFADATVASVSSGYGTAIITVVLTSATSGYARLNDLVRSSNLNMVGQQGLITAVTSVSGVDTIKIQSVNNMPMYAALNDTLSFSSNAFGENSVAPPNRKYGVTRYINQVQVFREVDEISDIQKVSKVEISINGQPYYTPLNHIYKLKSLNGFISAQMIAGVQSSTLFSDASPYLQDANGNPIQTTMGMDQYITTYGITNQVATLGTVGFTDVNTMIDSFIANKAPHNQMGFLGSRARRPWDVWLKNLGSSGVTSVRMIIDGKQIDMEVDRFTYGNFEFEFIYLPIFDHPQLFGPTITPDINGSVYWIPKEKIQVEGGGMEGRIQIRYLPKAMAGGNSMSNGIITEWHTGALAPIPTNSQMYWHTDWYTVQGLEMLGVQHCQKFRVA